MDQIKTQLNYLESLHRQLSEARELAIQYRDDNDYEALQECEEVTDKAKAIIREWTTFEGVSRQSSANSAMVWYGYIVVCLEQFLTYHLDAIEAGGAEAFDGVLAMLKTEIDLLQGVCVLG